MKLLLILPILIAVLELVTAAEVLPAVTVPQNLQSIKSISQQEDTYETEFNSGNNLEPAKDLEPPSSPLFEYSNVAIPQKYHSSEGSEATEAEASSNPEEDMETAGTVLIGRHSGRFFGPGIWLGTPSFNRYRNHYHYRPSFSHHHHHQPRRYQNRQFPGIWIGG